MRGLGGSRGQEGRAGGRWGCGRPSLTTLFLQELSKREVVAVGHLEVPAELAGLLRAAAGTPVRPCGGSGPGPAGEPAPRPSSRHRPPASADAPGGACPDSPAPG